MFKRLLAKQQRSSSSLLGNNNSLLPPLLQFNNKNAFNTAINPIIIPTTNNNFRLYCQACDASIPVGTPYEDHHLDIYLSNALEVMFTNDRHALEILDFVLAARPKQANALSKKAAILFGQLKFREGIEWLDKCLDSVPPSARVSIFEDVICTFKNNYFEEPYAMHLMKGIYWRHCEELGMAVNEFRMALLDRNDDELVVGLREELLKKMG